eukprot:g3200.t1
MTSFSSAVFTDTWVVDNTYFLLFGSSGCACCAAPQIEGINAKLEDFISQCPDLDFKTEVTRTEGSKFAIYIIEDFWRDRVIFRKMLKAAIKAAFPFWRENKEDIIAYWNGLSAEKKQTLTRVEAKDLMTFIDSNFQGSYHSLLSALAQQIVNFEFTGLPVDAVGELEVCFEKQLGSQTLQRITYFTLSCLGEAKNEQEGEPEPEGDFFLFKRLDEIVEKGFLEKVGPNEAERSEFRGDRRILRNVIFTRMIDAIFKAFRRDLLSNMYFLKEDVADSEEAELARCKEKYDEDAAIIMSTETHIAHSIYENIAKLTKDKLPVTLITGFLGSGKTTLLNFVLKADHGLRIAVVVNEFGEIDIDSQLIEKPELLHDKTANSSSSKHNTSDKYGGLASTGVNDNQILQLKNGCMCCTVNGEFVDSMIDILKNRTNLDYVMIETTGIADPKPIMESLVQTGLNVSFLM